MAFLTSQVRWSLRCGRAPKRLQIFGASQVVHQVLESTTLAQASTRSLHHLVACHGCPHREQSRIRLVKKERHTTDVFSLEANPLIQRIGVSKARWLEKGAL